MNAAARLVHQYSMSRNLVLVHKLTKQQILAVIITFGIIISVLSTIYVTHANRIAYANYERALTEYNHLQVDRSQLLLERSTYMVPSRVQKIAEAKLRMTMPDQESVVFIQE